MKYNINYHQFSTKIFMYGDSNNQDNQAIENFSDSEIQDVKSGNEFEKENASENRATTMHEIWGDNFVSDSLH